MKVWVALLCCGGTLGALCQELPLLSSGNDEEEVVKRYVAIKFSENGSQGVVPVKLGAPEYFVSLLGQSRSGKGLCDPKEHAMFWLGKRDGSFVVETERADKEECVRICLDKWPVFEGDDLDADQKRLKILFVEARQSGLKRVTQFSMMDFAIIVDAPHFKDFVNRVWPRELQESLDKTMAVRRITGEVKSKWVEWYMVIPKYVMEDSESKPVMYRFGDDPDPDKFGESGAFLDPQCVDRSFALTPIPQGELDESYNDLFRVLLDTRSGKLHLSLEFAPFVFNSDDNHRVIAEVFVESGVHVNGRKVSKGEKSATFHENQLKLNRPMKPFGRKPRSISTKPNARFYRHWPKLLSDNEEEEVLKGYVAVQYSGPSLGVLPIKLGSLECLMSSEGGEIETTYGEGLCDPKQHVMFRIERVLGMFTLIEEKETKEKLKGNGDEIRICFDDVAYIDFESLFKNTARRKGLFGYLSMASYAYLVGVEYAYHYWPRKVLNFFNKNTFVFQISATGMDSYPVRLDMLLPKYVMDIGDKGSLPVQYIIQQLRSQWHFSPNKGGPYQGYAVDFFFSVLVDSNGKLLVDLGGKSSGQRIVAEVFYETVGFEVDGWRLSVVDVYGVARKSITFDENQLFTLKKPFGSWRKSPSTSPSKTRDRSPVRRRPRSRSKTRQEGSPQHKKSRPVS